MKGATTPGNRSGDNMLENPPEQLLLRQSIMKRIGRSKHSSTNTITSFKRQQSNQLSQSQSQATPGGYSPPVPRIPQNYGNTGRRLFKWGVQGISSQTVISNLALLRI